MTPLRFFHLKSIGGQIAALVVASIVALHLILTASFLISRPDRAEPPPDAAHQLADAALLLNGTDASERPRILANIVRAFPQAGIELLAPGTFSVADDRDGPHLRNVRRHLGHQYKVIALAPNFGVHRVAVELPDGSVIAGRVEQGPHPPRFWGGPWMMTLLFALISVTMLGLWAAYALAAPLSSFARAAENFSLDGTADPLPERGPEEIRSVARALNRMHERIARLMSDRTRMLAAISHDLRTPITRLRLRAEFIEDEGNRRRMLIDLDQMRSMLESVLSLLRNDRKIEAVTLVDIASTLQVIADQFGDMGHVVHYDGPASATAVARPDDLHRGVTNLVENAIRFGAEVTIRLDVSGTRLVIDVEDDGPGISDARKQEMLEPFARGDDARTMDEHTGFGLGLSIARAIAIAHGGELSLHDRAPHGLIVRMQLPVWQQPRRAA
ncbi:signal transduction histidine kinase [Bradyrhizobium japonicum]|uniref:ATP-binding protein n=1 Tax=Bradyrhizobium TaxID=374 RepID=UPI0004140A3A|nr:MULTISPECIES: ATP-binding protein [Bradyrhizobium]MBR0881432.1 HAMP domain-containing protein [Bradyrhizobium liaoningense]MBR0947543.1 HAMP domain-containing protein [Bradyrhizobium liaoningense]MBR0996699.1 HAMP domain-containing protein [Bradyrhizobium liaoningense]MBR1026876.1 HAMP domain-containing protein [Bradyrhizobium liaoningense]MBR1070275.1 HAMP domain-containing protein [Bradyrhizobium liaoningense]